MQLRKFIAAQKFYLAAPPCHQQLFSYLQNNAIVFFPNCKSSFLCNYVIYSHYINLYAMFPCCLISINFSVTFISFYFIPMDPYYLICSWLVSLIFSSRFPCYHMLYSSYIMLIGMLVYYTLFMRTDVSWSSHVTGDLHRWQCRKHRSEISNLEDLRGVLLYALHGHGRTGTGTTTSMRLASCLLIIWYFSTPTFVIYPLCVSCTWDICT
jgi:hypothetical protein